MQIAIGYLDMDLDKFWDITPRQLQLKYEGRKQFVEEQHRDAWERTRWQTAILINKDRKRKDQVKLFDLVKFPWESKKDSKKLEKDRRKVQYLMAKANKKDG
tara:strand:- start:1464 stop:1769 length:306 start_codon:yes stop_codon:yes gene_type:complete